MANKLPTAIWLGCIAAASAGEPAPPPIVPAEAKLPNMNISMGYFTYSDGMDFDRINGELNISEFKFMSALSRPITVAGDIMLVPLVQYGLTSLDFDNTGKGFPLADEDLHSVSLHLAALKYDKSSPWFYGAWARAEVASDFQHMNGDDITFDIAGGVGYRYSNNFMVAAGAAVLNLNGDSWFCPGINFDWVINDQFRVGLYGPMPVISYTPNEDWNFSLRGNPGGGTWNITDNNGDSRSIDLSSYQVGAFVGRRLTGKLWLNAGVGFTVFNNIEYADPDGDNKLLDEDMGSGLFGQIGISLKAW
jgi:hypothetical protein